MSGLAGKRVLIVEDEHIVAMLVEDLIAELGAEPVGPATSLGKALEMARTADFDAAILDVNINGTRSSEVARMLRSRGIPFVLATGYGAAACEDVGQAAILQKPFAVDLLEAALSKAISAKSPSSRQV